MDFQNFSGQGNDHPYLNSNGNSQGGYAIQPHPGQKMAMASIFFACTAIVSTFVIPIILPCIFGGLSIIFAILSRGSEKKILPQATVGIILSAVIITLNLSVAFGAVYLYETSADFHQECNDLYQQTYGVSIDELMQQYQVQ